MGLGIGDFDLNGRLDILKTHFIENTPALYADEGERGFADRTLRAGLGALSAISTMTETSIS